MAAPPEKTIKDLNGVWVMNKTLSDDVDAILQIQNIGWFLRKAIRLATVTLTISQYEEDGFTHIDIQQVATGGISKTEELRTLNWEFGDHSDAIFGKVRGRSRWVKLGDLEGDEFLKKGWDDLEGEHVHSWVESEENKWTAEQIWGFELFDGKRYHCRHIIVRSTKDKDEWKQARLVYDYKGSD